MISSHILTLSAFALWLCLAVVMPWIRTQYRQRLFWALFVTGVPILGWLTLYWGPTAGVASLAIGMWLLFRRPVVSLRRRAN